MRERERERERERSTAASLQSSSHRERGRAREMYMLSCVWLFHCQSRGAARRECAYCVSMCVFSVCGHVVNHRKIDQVVHERLRFSDADVLISAAVAEFKGPEIFGVVRLAQLRAFKEACLVLERSMTGAEQHTETMNFELDFVETTHSGSSMEARCPPDLQELSLKAMNGRQPSRSLSCIARRRTPIARLSRSPA